jgi:hypothetical protein
MIARFLPLPLLLLAACEPEPPPGIDEVDWSAASGPATIRLERGVISLDGKVVGELREPGVLRQSRHRKLLKVLKLRSGQDPQSHDPPEQALLSQGWGARVELPADAPWDDVYPLIATAAWAGFGPFELAVLPELERATPPLAVDSRQPAPWSGEPILGVAPVVHLALATERRCAQLGFEVVVEPGGEQPQDGLRQLPQLLRSVGSEPLVDCSALWADAPELGAACELSRGPDADAPAPPRLLPGRSGLGLEPSLGAAGGRAVLQPASETSASLVLDALDDLLASGGVPPVIGLTKPAPAEELPCLDVKIDSLEGVRLAGARWLGEHRQPPR